MEPDEELDAEVPVPRWLPQPRLLDRASFSLALSAAAAQLLVYGATASTEGLFGLLVTLAGVLLSRRWLWLGLVVAVAGPMVNTLLGEQPLAPWAMVIFTLFSVAIRGIPGLWAGALIGTLAYSSIVASEAFVLNNPIAFAAMGFAFTAAAAGSAIRSHHRYWLELKSHAEEALAAREYETTQRVVEERIRIARDLHDVVGHEVAVLNVHLGVAELNTPPEAAAALSALGTARESIRAILQETQRILHVLRTADPPEPGLRPTPDAAGIAELVRSFMDLGMAIDTELGPLTQRIVPEVGTAAYRVVQEALTNAQRHGRGTVRLQVREEAELLVIKVSNARGDAIPRAASRRGFGLVGMRERVLSAGGTLDIVADDRSFTLLVRLRIDGHDVS